MYHEESRAEVNVHSSNAGQEDGTFIDGAPQAAS